MEKPRRFGRGFFVFSIWQSIMTNIEASPYSEPDFFMAVPLEKLKLLWATSTLAMLVAIAFFSLWPLEQLPAFPGTDKTHHVIAYAMLMLPTALFRPKNWVLYGGLFIAFSGAIELIQPYINRYGEWADMIANTVGVMGGILLASLIKLLFSVRSNLKQGPR